MTTICILSDSHGSIHQEIIKLANQSDIVIHAGDVIDESTLDSLLPKEKLIAVAGNNDGHISALDDIERLHFPSGSIVIEHGHQHGWYQPSHASLRSTHANAKVVIYGHTHKQIIDQENTPWIVNPGASGKVRNYGGARCLLMKVHETQEWQIKSYIFD